jgi:hypothetical protein
VAGERLRPSRRGAGAGLGCLEVRDQIRRRKHRHTCRPAALVKSGHGGRASGLRWLQARDGIGPNDRRDGVGGTIDHRVEEVQLVLDLGRRRDDSDRATRPQFRPTENTN